MTAEEPYTVELASDVYAYVQPDGGWCLNNAGWVSDGVSTLLVDTAATERRARALYRALEDTTVPAPMLLVNSISMVIDAVVAGLGIGALPMLLAERQAGLQALTEPLADCETEIWLLTHPESRHLRRIAVVASHLTERIALP